MKVIPTDDLIELLNRYCPKFTSQDTVDQIFKVYGDDYFKDPGESEWEKVNDNVERAKILSCGIGS